MYWVLRPQACAILYLIYVPDPFFNWLFLWLVLWLCTSLCVGKYVKWWKTHKEISPYGLNVCQASINILEIRSNPGPDGVWAGCLGGGNWAMSGSSPLIRRRRGEIPFRSEGHRKSTLFCQPGRRRIPASGLASAWAWISHPELWRVSVVGVTPFHGICWAAHLCTLLNTCSHFCWQHPCECFLGA